jgi:hypothetical protein
MKSPFLFLLTVAALGSGACSSTSTGNGNTGTGASATVAPADCKPRCEAKATQCGASAAEAPEACSNICASATESQLTCLDAKSCAELNSASNLASVCPATTSGSSGSSNTSSGAALGAACTCANVTSMTSQGLCQGTGVCSDGLTCVYEGGGGKGKCFAEKCCSSTTACDSDKSLLTACEQGTCTRTSLGYYCGK